MATAELRPAPKAADVVAGLALAREFEARNPQETPFEREMAEAMRESFSDLLPLLRRLYDEQRHQYAFTGEQRVIIERTLDCWPTTTFSERLAVSVALRYLGGKRW